MNVYVEGCKSGGYKKEGVGIVRGVECVFLYLRVCFFLSGRITCETNNRYTIRMGLGVFVVCFVRECFFVFSGVFFFVGKVTSRNSVLID